MSKKFLPLYNSAKIIKIDWDFPSLWSQMHCQFFMVHSVHCVLPVLYCCFVSVFIFRSLASICKCVTNVTSLLCLTVPLLSLFYELLCGDCTRVECRFVWKWVTDRYTMNMSISHSRWVWCRNILAFFICCNKMFPVQMNVVGVLYLRRWVF